MKPHNFFKKAQNVAKKYQIPIFQRYCHRKFVRAYPFCSVFVLENLALIGKSRPQMNS